MPIYEYRCCSCDHAFEALLFGSERARCPACEGTQLEKQFSAFSARSDARPDLAPSSSCGTCGDPRGPGACASE